MGKSLAGIAGFAKPSGIANGWFHASHESIDKLNPRTVRNLDTIGTWVTGDPAAAKTLYGPNVYKADVVPKNMLQAPTDNFDSLFYSNANLFKQTFPNEPLSTLEKFKQKGLAKADPQIESMRQTYLQSYRQMLQDAGYDGIVWKNSRIDLSKNDKPHDVAVLFHDEPIGAKLNEY